jgi:hypothetical protein
MKRFLITLILIAGLAAPAAAGWPEGYQGDELPDGCFNIRAEIVDWLDRNPWGMISPVGVQAAGDICVEDGVATLNLQYIVSESCVESPWGVVGEDEVCEYRVRVEFSEPIRVLPFVSGAYIAYVHEDGDIVPYEALVWDAESDSGRFIDGVFDFVTPLWFYESDEYTRLVWEVAPRTGDLIFPQKRRVNPRRR